MPLLGVDIGGSSVKLAILRSADDEQPVFTARSASYRRPAVDVLSEHVAQVLAQAVAAGFDSFNSVGVCLPGVFDPVRRVVTASVNIPSLVNVPCAQIVLARAPKSLKLAPIPPEDAFIINSDAFSAAVDAQRAMKIAGRAHFWVLGTGVGGAVLDDGVPLHVSGQTPGHLGHIDVSLDSNPPKGPDGSVGSLEAYLGAEALKSRLQTLGLTSLAALPDDDPSLRALAKAIRIAHAIYRPEHVVLLGGVGLALGPKISALQAIISKGLTSLARPGWSLRTGLHEHHAAAGAARLSARKSQSRPQS